MRRFRWVLAIGLVGAAACGGGGGGDGGPPTVTSVIINGDSTVIIAGTRQLSATAMSGNTTVPGVTFLWSSSDTTRARVNSTGLVTGVRLGTAGISAEAVVSGTPTGVTSGAHALRTRIGAIVFTPAPPSFASLHDTVLVTADARDALNASVPGVTFTWQSRNGAVVTTADSGVHKAIVASQANGSTRIVATGNGVSDSITATVQQVAATLSITPDTQEFDRIGATLAPTVTAQDARGNAMSSGALSWTTQDNAVATVNLTTGLITSVNEGQSRVVGTSGALKDTIRIGVALVYSSIQIATSGATPAAIDSGVINRLNGSLQLGVIVRDPGNTIVPAPQGVSWSLKHGTIASIGASTGLISGNTNTGRDSIAVSARGAVDTALLVVRQVLASINVTPASPAALNFVGDTQSFAAQPRDSGGAAIAGQTITWSTNNAVLGIDADGLATSVGRTSAAGTTVKVRAATGGITDSSRSIVVRQVPRFADLNPNSFGTLHKIGGSVQASCVVRDSASDTIPNHPCNWSALTANVVTFNPATAKTTTITAAGNGSTTINATAATSVVGINSVTVDQVAASVSLLPVNFGTPDVTMKVSQSAPFIAVVKDSNNNVDSRPRTDVTWSIAPGTSATVSASTSETATVTTNATPGSETVTATIGSFSGQRVVTVSGTPISFSTSVQTVFSGNCTGCHSGAGAPQGLNLQSGSSYTLLVDHAAGELPEMNRVRPFRPDSSYMVHKIQGTQLTVGGSGVRMPFGCSGATCLSNVTINLIRNWILQGAPNN